MLATVEADHPSLPGHFPGRPLVPGVVLLERVVDAARAWRGASLRIAGFPSVKFLSPLQPGQAFEIHLQDDGAQLRFSCSAGARLLAQGTLTVKVD